MIDTQKNMESQTLVRAGSASCGRFVLAVVDIPLKQLLRIHGYRDMARVRPAINDAAREMISLAEAHMAPEVAYRRLPIAPGDGGVAVEGTDTVFHGAALAKVLAGCGEAIAFVLTAGAAIDRESAALVAAADILHALFLETAGWLVIEKATRAFAKHLSEGLGREGLSLTRRTGPGYADWPLTEQRDLFDLFADVDIPVRLLESSAMVPKMSRSGLYGVAPSPGRRGASG